MGWPPQGAVGEWWLLSCHPAAVTGVEPLRAEAARDAPGPSGDPEDDPNRSEDHAPGNAGSDGNSDRGPEEPPAGPSDGEAFDGWLDGPQAPGLLPDGDAFPLLLKFLDTDDVLSVQVHPDDAVARQHGLRHGKTEAWHVLHAEPGACLYLGTAKGVTAREFVAAVERRTARHEVESMLRRVPALPGETWLVEAGTIHAVGAGVTLFEVQQTSDATWRLYDWERKPVRTLHLEPARKAAKERPAIAPVPPPGTAPGWSRLVACHAFVLEHGRVDGELPLANPGGWSALTVLAGLGELHCHDGGHPLFPGHTLLTWGRGVLRGEGLAVLCSFPAGRGGPPPTN